jgi:proprotein convertase subtilisin/kexin type 2
MRKGDGTLVSIRFAVSVFAAFAAVGLFGCGGGGGGGPFISLLNIYTVGGTITGLSGTVVLQNNSGNNLAVSANGAFTFTTPLASGSAYAVTVLTQPTGPSQTCTVTNGSGTVGSTNVTNVSVSCTTNSFTIGGTVSGLAGTGLVLQNNGGNSLAIAGNGGFTFSTQILSGATYTVTVLTQPTSQTCTVTAGSGTVGAANVTSVAVNCVSWVAGPDPLFTDQWHLQNTGQAGGTAGQDVNVVPVWNATPSIKGTGVRIAVVDGGLEIAHEDLSPNVVPGQSHNYVTGTADPTPTDPADNHGTAVGGVAAARDLNGLGGAGAAPRASLVGYNFLQNQTTVNEADAMTRNAAAVFVSNNSWGFANNGRWNASQATWRAAIDTGLSTGRNGLGTIYTWAAGNGGLVSDNSNYDGLANYRGVIAVGAVNDKGVKSSYSNRGANLWVSAPAGEFCTTHTITTTDRTGAAGYNNSGNNIDYGNVDYTDSNYTKCFNGTSAAAPLAAGVIALVLEARPTLTWRDLRIILAQSARKNDPGNAEWTVNGGGFNINHNYGSGVADANAAVALARTWVNVGAQVTFATATAIVNSAIPDNNATGVSNTINVVGSGIGRIEFVEITFNGNHTYVGDLDVTLTAPSGTVSRLSEPHICRDSNSPTVVILCLPVPSNTWRFGSARHLGEAADGNWTLLVRDLQAADTGTFTSWQLTFYGRLN